MLTTLLAMKFFTGASQKYFPANLFSFSLYKIYINEERAKEKISAIDKLHDWVLPM